MKTVRLKIGVAAAKMAASAGRRENVAENNRSLSSERK
jgi:hypothetical protein